jgi:hypothetical protein
MGTLTCLCPPFCRVSAGAHKYCPIARLRWKLYAFINIRQEMALHDAENGGKDPGIHLVKNALTSLVIVKIYTLYSSSYLSFCITCVLAWPYRENTEAYKERPHMEKHTSPALDT